MGVEDAHSLRTAVTVLIGLRKIAHLPVAKGGTRKIFCSICSILATLRDDRIYGQIARC
jgi:hypothetical protein